jgi:hypothetical protein|mmetsp:Transcript_686/g.1224  ORF Transcript_686/g.1224 Transcript_686/m.1224 type:complete len:94 (-) Transcript_686:134-415(-)
MGNSEKLAEKVQEIAMNCGKLRKIAENCETADLNLPPPASPAAEIKSKAFKLHKPQDFGVLSGSLSSRNHPKLQQDLQFSIPKMHFHRKRGGI